MATIAENLSRIQSAKADIKTAIEAKGVTVPSSATIDTYDDYISQISGGGGGIPMPSNLSAAILNDYGLLTSAAIKSGVTSISNNVFYNCSSLSSVTIPNSVTTIGNGAFASCTSLTSIEIPNSVTTIGNNAFSNCSSLTSVTIQSGVTSIDEYTFYNCSSLTSIEIPNSVTTIGNNAFEYCTSIKSIVIPNSVTTISNSVFNYCYSLKNVSIGNSVTSIGNNAFSNCSKLTSITVNAVTPPTIGSNTFNNTNNCPIYVPSESVNAYKSASIWSDYASRIQAIPTLQWVTFNNGDTIPSDLDIYGFSGVSQNLQATFGYGKHFQFTPSRNYIDWCVADNTTALCHCGNVLNTEVISVICSEVSCDGYYNQGATVSGTIQLYIYA